MNFFSLYKRALLYKLKNKTNIDPHVFDEKISLESLFSFYETDKADTYGKLKKKGHGYTSFYEKHLQDIRKKKINILEIGSFSGASAASFSKYFQNSEIFCIDVNISSFIYSSKNIHVFGMDTTNTKSVSSFLEKIKKENNINFFDIIIDDGSHKLFDMLFTLNLFLKYVKKSGYYIIKDYKLAEIYDHLNEPKEISITSLIEHVKRKEKFKSNVVDNDTLSILFNNIESIQEYKGNQETSDIVFFKKN